MFVPRALPGELLTARITSAKSRWAKAEKVESLRPHEHAAEPSCQHFGPCGGCTFQSLEYAAQLRAKESQVAELMQRVGGISDPTTVLPIVPCDMQLQYRNKMEFSFGPTSTRSGTVALALGLHRPGSNTAVVPIAACSLQTHAANEILHIVGQACSGAGLDRNGDTGATPLLEHVVIRHSQAQDAYLVNIITGRPAGKELAPIAAALMRHPKVTSVVNSVSVPGRPLEERRIAKEVALGGSGKLVERLCGLEFEFGANSFFQTNTRQAERLFGMVQAAAAAGPEDIVCDLYCGTGTIALTLARQCRLVWGIEVNPAAVTDAKRNADRNGIANAGFLVGDVNKLLPELGTKVPAPTIAVVDPARPGLEAEAVAFLRGCGARRLVYVSCNPASQARDIKALCSTDLGASGQAYRLVSVQPVDMYPQTPHVETIAVLERA